MVYQQIGCFLAVADFLSFTAAAESLHISQQAVTRQVAALEQDLGVRLFVRTTRSVSLTPAGQVLRDDFTSIKRQVDISINKVRNMSRFNTSVFSIGIFTHFSKGNIITPLISRLMETFPDVYFDFHLLDFADLRNQISDERISLCVTTSSDWSFWPDVNVFILKEKRFEIVYSLKSPLAQLPNFSIDVLKDYAQLTLPSETLLCGQDDWSKRIPFSYSISNLDLQALLIRLEAGLGFGILTRVFEGSDSPSLRFQPVPDQDAHAEIVCVSRNKDCNPMVAKVRREIKDFFEQNNI
jgi:DNA-binding transcriptional LysR family regulator